MKPAWFAGCFILIAAAQLPVGTTKKAENRSETRQYGYGNAYGYGSVVIAVNRQPTPQPLYWAFFPPPTEKSSDRWVLWWLLTLLLAGNSPSQGGTSTNGQTGAGGGTVTTIPTTIQAGTSRSYADWWSVPATGCRYNFFTQMTYTAAQTLCRDTWSAELAYRGLRGTPDATREALRDEFKVRLNVNMLPEWYIGLDAPTNTYTWADGSTDATSVNDMFAGGTPTVSDATRCAVMEGDSLLADGEDCTTARYFLCEICP